MEEILRKLHKDASGHKHKAIRDACVYAFGECTDKTPLHPPPPPPVGVEEDLRLSSPVFTPQAGILILIRAADICQGS